MKSRLSVCVLGVAVILGLQLHSSLMESMCGAYAPGDIIIGILSSVHTDVKDLQPWIPPDMSACINFDFVTFIQSLASIHTIETINDSGFLPGIKLGYLMCDPCGYATKALQCVEYMLSINGSLTVLTDNSNFNPPVKAFLGERYSESCISAAKLLSLHLIPQVSCTASAPALSDKLRYASFFRVIPSDIYQTQALAKLIRHFNWDWIGVVTLDDEYGKAVFENFLPQAVNEGICFDFHQVVPKYLNVKEYITKVAEVIRSSSAKVVLLILRSQQVEMLFEEMIKTNTSRIWIAGDAWSMARYLMKMKDINKVGDILGFTFITGNIPGFEEYLKNLRPSPGGRNDFIRMYKQIRCNASSACSETDPQQANDDYLLQTVDVTEAYSQRVAVYAVAHAIKKLLKCNDTACSGDPNLLPYELVDILRNVNFTLDNQTYAFDKNGDFENGYDLMMWKKNGDERISEVVGRFLIKNGDVEIYDHRIPWTNTTVPLSRCSEPCPPGTEKMISSISCCYTCTNCSEGFYSSEWNQLFCQRCPEGQWSLPGWRECQKWKIWFLEWSAAYSIVVMIGTVIGGLLLVFSFTVFILYKQNPIIEDILVISCLMKFGLMVSFGSVILFLGRPNIHLCRAQQTMYGLGFTLCVSCIVVKVVHAFLEIMSSNPAKQRTLRKFDKPFVIIGLLTFIQALICIFWMIFDPVDVMKTQSKTQPLTIIHLCTQGSMYGFGAMHVYIALLAVVCLLLVFKGRDTETEPIVFSMLIHLFAWLCFIPVYITQEELRPIVQISAIMVSNYGVIFCHFTPKWFKILSEDGNLKAANKNNPFNHFIEETSRESEVVFDSALGSRESISTRSMASQDQSCSAMSKMSNWVNTRRRRPRSIRARTL